MAGGELDVNSLILRVIEGQAHGDALDRLEVACSTSRDLSDVADQLVTYFVNEARDADLSWTQIGERMGITKQAARQRFVPRDIPDEPSVLKERIYGRYTDRAKHVIVLAQSLAKAHHHHYIDTEHILLGICHEPAGGAARVIESCGVGLDSLAAEVTKRLFPPSSEVPDRPPFTRKAKKVMELTARKARQLDHDWIGTEHLLLGLLLVRTGLAADVLMESGITPQRAEREAQPVIAERQEGEPGLSEDQP